jgi:hypothetical protein
MFGECFTALAATEQVAFAPYIARLVFRNPMQKISVVPSIAAFISKSHDTGFLVLVKKT